MRREHCAKSLRGPGIRKANEQVVCPPFPRDCHPAAGHPLPDLLACRRIPARHPDRGSDRALPPRLSWSTRPRVPGAGRGDPALTPRMPAPAAARRQRPCRQDEPGDRRRMMRRSRTLEGRAQVAADLACLCPSAGCSDSRKAAARSMTGSFMTSPGLRASPQNPHKSASAAAIPHRKLFP